MCLAIMAGSALVFESIIDRVMLVVTEAAGEGVHVQVIEEHTQNRMPLIPYLSANGNGLSMEPVIGSGFTSR